MYIFKKLVKLIFLRFLSKNSWEGNFKTWQDALSKSDGYDKAEILEKCKDSLLMVKNNEKIYERDSVTFDYIQYSWPLLAQLLYISIENANKLNVLDFGGSLGSTYFQNRSYLNKLLKLNWIIIEQNNYVDTGKRYFESDELKFYNNLSDIEIDEFPNVIILGSVLQYLENPYSYINDLCNLNCNYIIIDRTPVCTSYLTDRLTVQNVPKEIYNASYPCWIFSENKLINSFNKYERISSFNSTIEKSIRLDNNIIEFKGYILKLIK